MSHKCNICSLDTIFFIWSTSRDFPTRKLIRKMKIKSKWGRAKVMKEGITVCFPCYKDLINERINK